MMAPVQTKNDYAIAESVIKTNNTNLPNDELLSSMVTILTPHSQLLPTDLLQNKYSQREHPPDYFMNSHLNERSGPKLSTKSNDNNNSRSSSCSSINNSFTFSVRTPTSPPTTSLSHIKYRYPLQRRDDDEYEKLLVNKIATRELKDSAPAPPTSQTKASPTLAASAYEYKTLHRKDICNRRMNLRIETAVTILRHIMKFYSIKISNSTTFLSTQLAPATVSVPSSITTSTSLTPNEWMKTRSKNDANATTTVVARCKAAAAAAAGGAKTKFRILPSLGATSFFTLLTLICLEMVLLSTVSNCAKTFYMHWNTSNSIFRIDNTDHIIDVNKGNLAFEFDQVHIICPVYEPGTFENETEKYIIYNVSKVEYETCRITNADPRVIAICDKPQKLMFFTITFRPFTPQPGGLEFLPGNDYYFISTSSKDDLYRRIGGRCSTNNMKVVFKVCCAPEEKNKTSTGGISPRGGNIAGVESGGGGVSNSGIASGETINVDVNTPTNINQHHTNNINAIGINGVSTGLLPSNVINNAGDMGGMQLKPTNGASGTSINTNIDQFNRIPIQTNGINVMGNNIGGIGLGSHGGSGIMFSPGHGGVNMIPNNGVNGGGSVIGIGQYPGHRGQTGIRINNVASQQHHPLQKNINSNNNHDDQYFEKHPNEVVKNEELTYNSGASTLHRYNFSWSRLSSLSIFSLSSRWNKLFNVRAINNNYNYNISSSNRKNNNSVINIFKYTYNVYHEKLKFMNNLVILLSSLLFVSIVIYILRTLILPIISTIALSENGRTLEKSCCTSPPAKQSKMYKNFTINVSNFR